MLYSVLFNLIFVITVYFVLYFAPPATLLTLFFLRCFTIPCLHVVFSCYEHFLYLHHMLDATTGEGSL